MMRIVSLLPSATEMVCTLGCADLLVGRSHDCDYPEEVLDLPAVTTTHLRLEEGSASIDAQVVESLSAGKALYGLRTDLLAQLRPDLILTQDLCRVCTVTGAEVEAAALCLQGPVEVVSASPESLAGVWDSIRVIGRALGVGDRAERLVASLEGRLEHLRARRVLQRPRVALLEWLAPPFSAGHWNPELIEVAGGLDALGNGPGRSRRIDVQEIVRSAPDVLVIACCGMNRARGEAELPAFRAEMERAAPGWLSHRSLFVVDGQQYFSRPGPRLVDSAEWLSEILTAWQRCAS
ncbi:MAG TPA: ABC transporter substrate-binding protein [Candidatus Polarisedimenticolaceae bacterium]|nr:ABC transporter substrate-binding protein [Candidatus Polarisedimenticolaceae bacterium]